MRKQNLRLALIAASISALAACGGSSGRDSSSSPSTNTPAPTPSNTAPVANAGENRQVTIGSSVEISAASSSDADGDGLTYRWTISEKPDSSSAALSSEDAVSTTFLADVTGSYVITLIVNDGVVDSEAVSITIQAVAANGNQPPVAHAGTDQNVAPGSAVTLDGSLSSDLENAALSYLWQIESTPVGSSAELEMVSSSAPVLTVDQPGTYQISLVVNDGELDSQKDTVVITASNSNVNIKGIELTNRAGSCANYVGSYFANVTDIQRAIDFTGDIMISLSGDTCTLSSNEIPNYDFNDQTANFATPTSEQAGSYELSVSPQLAQTATELAIGITNAVFLNGVTLDILAAACYNVGNDALGRERIGCGQDEIDNPWRYDPMSPLNQFGTDSHNAHTQPDGTYHYHGDPRALFDLDCEANTSVSPVIGFAADGFPIYGPCFSDNGTIRKAQSSYQLKDAGGQRQAVNGYETPQAGVGVIASNNYDGQFTGDWEYTQGSGDLDRCNGMTINGQYGYYVTDKFPWVMGCFAGEVNDSFLRSGPGLSNNMHSHGEHFHRH